jgi:hypothetical protein
MRGVHERRQRRRVHRWLKTCAFLAAMGLPVRARADCSKDTDCKGDRVCEHGRCVSPGAASPAVAPAPIPPPAPPPPRQPAPPPRPAPVMVPKSPVHKGKVPLVVSVAGPARVPNLVVEIDGVPLDPSAWNLPQPVDWGPHQVTARAPDRRSWRATVDVSAPNASVQVPVLEEERISAAAQGTQLVALKSIGGATWYDGMGFVLAGDAPAPPPEVPPPTLPAMRNDDLSHVSVAFDAGAALNTQGPGQQAWGVRSDFVVRPEFRHRTSWVAPWFDLRLTAGYLPSNAAGLAEGFGGGGGHVGVDVHPLRWTWIGFGPSFGYGAFFEYANSTLVGDTGPEIGLFNVHFRTKESENSPPVFDAAAYVDEVFTLGTSSLPGGGATYLGTRIGVGGKLRFRAFVQGLAAGGGAGTIRTGQTLYAGIGLGSPE